MPKSYLFETETCSRCGGSGQYSYCQMHGTRCFKCGGAGVALTKRGAAAQARYREALRISALDVQVGMRVRIDDLGRILTWTIAEVIEGKPIHGRSKDPQTGEWRDSVQRSVTLVSKEGKRYGFGGAIMLQRVPTADEKAALVADCLAFQASLTKAGTVRKGPAPKAAAPADADDDFQVIE